MIPDSRQGVRASDYQIEDRGYETPCWVWKLWRDRDGYGILRIDGVNRRAHRLLYEATYGVPIKGLSLHHRCEVRACVRPDHLTATTEGGHRTIHRRITTEQVARIRSSGESTRALARELGFSASHIWRIRVGQEGPPL